MSFRDALARSRVVAVIRAPNADAAAEAGEAVIEGGIRAVEVAFSTPGAAAAIERLRRRHPAEILVGAGTVREQSEVAAAIAAGADFLVSPGIDEAVIAAARRAGAVHLPGVLTATEVTRARALGAAILKLFPAALGGPALLRALREPFGDVDFVPTGGIGVDAVPDWLEGGAIAVGAGGALCPREAIEAGRFDQIRDRAQAFAASARSRGEAEGGRQGAS